MRLLSPLVLTAVAVAYTAQIIPYALAKPFWHDEIYTVLLARLPSLADTWRASADGADLSPPLNLWLTRAAHVPTGVGLISTRLPALLGFFVAIVSVFAVVRRRAGTAAAVTGALALFFTAGFRYAAEARGYGVMMGLCGITIYAWTEAAAGRRRGLYVPVLCVALAASMWNHYFGVLVFVPVIAGEAVRFVQRHRLDLPMAAAIAGAVIFALPLYPLMTVAAAQRSSFWAGRATAPGIPDIYRFLLAPMLEPAFLTVIAVVVAFTGVAAIIRGRSMPGEGRRVPAHEAAALAAGVAIPIFGLVLAWLIAGVLVPRYLLSAVVPIGIALALMLWRANTHRSPAEALACALFIMLVAAGFVRDPPAFRHPVADRPVLLNSLRTPVPTVVSSSLQYLQLWYYTPPELKGRMVYLADPSEALRLSGSDTIDRGYIALSRWTSVTVEPYESFVARHSSFRVYEAGSGWLLAKLEASGAGIEEIGRDPGGRLFQVTLSR